MFGPLCFWTRLLLMKHGKKPHVNCSSVTKEDRADEWGIRPSRLPAIPLSHLPTRRRSVTTDMAAALVAAKVPSEPGTRHGRFWVAEADGHASLTVVWSATYSGWRS